MADPNQITLRSEKSQFLTFEEMDQNLLELKDSIIGFNSFIDETFENFSEQLNQSVADTAKLTSVDNVFETRNQFTDVLEVSGQALISGEINFLEGGTLKLPIWTTSTRPINEATSIGYNIQLLRLEYYDGLQWKPFGGSSLDIDTASDSEFSIPFTPNTGDQLSETKVNNLKFKYNPLKNYMKVGWVLQPIVVDSSMTIPSGFASVTGTKTIQTGVVVDVEPGAEWTIV